MLTIFTGARKRFTMGASTGLMKSEYVSSLIFVIIENSMNTYLISSLLSSPMLIDTMKSSGTLLR